MTSSGATHVCSVPYHTEDFFCAYAELLDSPGEACSLAHTD